MRLLLVEDDRMIGESLQRALRLEGYAVDWVRDAAAAEGTLASERFDLVLLDLGLPAGGRAEAPADGLDILRAARSRGDATPVIVLTARDARGDRVAGLDAGADDYLVKPSSSTSLTPASALSFAAMPGGRSHCSRPRESRSIRRAGASARAASPWPSRRVSSRCSRP